MILVSSIEFSVFLNHISVIKYQLSDIKYQNQFVIVIFSLPQPPIVNHL